MHAEAVRLALAGAMAAAAVERAEREPDILAGTPGFYLDFELPVGSEDAAERLENRHKHIELVAVRPESGDSPARATVFVPDTAADHFLRKVEQYRDEEYAHRQAEKRSLDRAHSERGARCGPVGVHGRCGAVSGGRPSRSGGRSGFAQGHAESFDAVIQRLEIPAQAQRLVFPDREVRLIYGSEITVARLFVNTDSIAEIRRARDTPAQFMRWSNVEQAARAADLAGRVDAPENPQVAVCLLDTGVTQPHPLLSVALDPGDVQAYDPTWPGGDSHGHGTNMAGSALYGDLTPLFAGNARVPLTHCLESVKILPDQGQNEPKLYGAITRESIARAEVQAPERRRAVCMAVTSDVGTNRGIPSSWSAAVDQLCFGEDDARRLILVSAGNIREGLSKAGYPARNEIEPIENPAQAWNAITVGAFTDKSAITDPTYEGWEPVAPVGDLCPTSRTSVSWERKWPLKPDIVLEGGNWAALGDQIDCPDDLGLLTTYRDPTIRHFDIFRDTSAATALGANLAGKIIAAMPQRWPETIRALMIHSAEWTPAMTTKV